MKPLSAGNSKAAVDDGVLHTNPAEKLGRQLRFVTPASTRQKEIKAFTKEQRRLFLETAARGLHGTIHSSCSCWNRNAFRGSDGASVV